MRIIEADTQTALPLGRQGEKNVTTVAFDVHGWLEEFGAGTFTLLHKRNGDDAGYPVKTVLEDGKVLWTIDEADVFRPGTGVAQLIMMVDGKVAKSGLYKTSTSQSLNETKKPPEAWKAWVDSIFEAVGTYPRINTVGNWEVFLNGAWTDSGVSAKGKVPVKGVDYFDGHTPVMTGVKEGKTNTILADGVPLISIKDAEGGAVTEDAITEALGYKPADPAEIPEPVDVRINGASIVQDGVASIPDADEGRRGVLRSSYFYGTAMYNGILMPLYHDAQQFSTDPNTFFVGKGTLNNVLAAPSLMPALTDEEKIAAQQRIGVLYNVRDIVDITLAEDSAINITADKDGNPLKIYETALCIVYYKKNSSVEQNNYTIRYRSGSKEVGQNYSSSIGVNTLAGQKPGAIGMVYNYGGIWRGFNTGGGGNIGGLTASVTLLGDAYMAKKINYPYIDRIYTNEQFLAGTRILIVGY